MLIVTRQIVRPFEYHACISDLLATYGKRLLDVRPSRHGVWLFGGSCGSGPNNQQVRQLLRCPSPCTMRACLELAEFLVFDLANQRSTDSVTEDSVNKPWRPVPAGYIAPIQMRRLLLAALPVVLIIHFILGAWQETSLLFGLTWMYNDLQSGNESFILWNLIISLAFGLYNGNSLRVACGAGHTIRESG